MTKAMRSTWSGMMRRCFDSKNKDFARYGGRGITVCEKWKDFKKFQKDMGDRPEGYSLDRIDNDGNYEPSNCRWATRKEQQNNMSCNLKFNINGKEYRFKELCEELKIKPTTLRLRLHRGWPIERAISEPINNKRKSA
jgi:hypothetical protein